MEPCGRSIGVVIPAFNPCSRLADVVAGLPGFVAAAVIVDDGSAVPVDPATLPSPVPVHVERHEKNRGVGAAIVTGYRRCREMGLDVAVVMGADDQMDPSDLGPLVEPVLTGRASYSKGDRLSHRECLSVMPPSRRFGNVCLTFLTSLATGLPVMDAQCGYTALRLDCLERVPLDRIYPRYGFPNDMLAAVSGAGLVVADVVVRPVYGNRRSGIVWPFAMAVYPLIIMRSMVTRLHAAVLTASVVRRGGKGGA